MSTPSRRFEEMVRFRAPAGLLAAVEAAARQRHQGSAEFLRQVVLQQLRKEGVRLKPSETKPEAHA